MLVCTSEKCRESLAHAGRLPGYGGLTAKGVHADLQSWPRGIRGRGLNDFGQTLLGLGRDWSQFGISWEDNGSRSGTRRVGSCRIQT